MLKYVNSKTDSTVPNAVNSHQIIFCTFQKRDVSFKSITPGNLGYDKNYNIKELNGLMVVYQLILCQEMISPGAIAKSVTKIIVSFRFILTV